MHFFIQIQEIRVHQLNRAVTTVNIGYLQMYKVIQEFNLRRYRSIIVRQVINDDSPTVHANIAEVVQAILAVWNLVVLNLTEGNRMVSIFVVQGY